MLVHKVQLVQRVHLDQRDCRALLHVRVRLDQPVIQVRRVSPDLQELQDRLEQTQVQQVQLEQLDIPDQ